MPGEVGSVGIPGMLVVIDFIVDTVLDEIDSLVDPVLGEVDIVVD